MLTKLMRDYEHKEDLPKLIGILDQFSIDVDGVLYISFNNSKSNNKSLLKYILELSHHTNTHISKMMNATENTDDHHKFKKSNMYLETLALLGRACTKGDDQLPHAIYYK